MTKTLSYADAKKFYNRFGIRQDNQPFEDPAIDDLLRQSDFETAQSVVELGCGTGRIARRLLWDYLPEDATYVGFDLSETMLAISRERMVPFGDRAQVLASDGSINYALPSESAERFLCTYVLDLLSPQDISKVIDEAHRILKVDGLLVLAGLTHAVTPFGKVIETLWTTAHRVRPVWVGGCRPLVLTNYLMPPENWLVTYRNIITKMGMTSEVLVVQKQR